MIDLLYICNRYRLSFLYRKPCFDIGRNTIGLYKKKLSKLKVREKREKREQEIENYIDRIHFWKPYFDIGRNTIKIGRAHV